jgi:hypothetical protein
MLDSASTYAMIAVKELSRAKEFYGGKLRLTAADELPTAVRYATQGGTWFLVYQSEFAGTAKSTCMRFEVEDIEALSESFGGCAVRGVNVALCRQPSPPAGGILPEGRQTGGAGRGDRDGLGSRQEHLHRSRRRLPARGRL